MEIPTDKAPEKPKEKNVKRIIIIIIIILLLLLAIYFLFLYFFKSEKAGDLINVNQTTNKINRTNVLATTTNPAKLAKAVASSENYDMLQINLEGSATNIFDFSENEILTVSNVASELYTAKEGDKSEIRAVISCQTSKRSYIEVEYFKSGEKNKKVIKDTFLGFNHVIVLPSLDPDSVYRYSISATDLNQITVYSEQFVFYTGVGNISLVDVLENAVQKVFGWALGK